VHAEIRKRRDAFIARSKAIGAKAVVLDIPLLFETGSERDVDKTIVISSQPEIQRTRVLARPGMTEERLALILSKQMPDAEKRARADAVIDNNGSLADLKKSLLDILQTWGI
jgi:dephospho-CoA kinase